MHGTGTENGLYINYLNNIYNQIISFKLVGSKLLFDLLGKDFLTLPTNPFIPNSKLINIMV